MHAFCNRCGAPALCLGCSGCWGHRRSTLPSRTSKRREVGQVHGEGLGERLGRVRTDWSGQAWGRDAGASGRRMGVSPLWGAGRAPTSRVGVRGARAGAGGTPDGSRVKPRGRKRAPELRAPPAPTHAWCWHRDWMQMSRRRRSRGRGGARLVCSASAAGGRGGGHRAAGTERGGAPPTQAPPQPRASPTCSVAASA